MEQPLRLKESCSRSPFERMGGAKQGVTVRDAHPAPPSFQASTTIISWKLEREELDVRRVPTRHAFTLSSREEPAS